jgi:DNA-binding PadR family transcriptional regulator
LGSADLQLLLLSLLAEKPSYGYELIKALEERSSGYYSPSPGMVYPALTYLEEIGFATVQTEGAKKLYQITDAGRAHLNQNGPAVDTLLEQLRWIGRRVEHWRRAMAPGSSERDERGDDVDPARDQAGRPPTGESAPELQVARYNLRLALYEKLGATLEEQRRIAGILQRAAAEIRGT